MIVPTRGNDRESASGRAKPAPAGCSQCTHEPAFPPWDGSSPPAAAHSGMARSVWSRIADRSAAARHTPCSRWAPDAHSSARPWLLPARRPSCAANGPFLPMRWLPDRSSRDSQARTQTTESAAGESGFSGCCSSLKRYRKERLAGILPYLGLRKQRHPTEPCSLKRLASMLRKIFQTPKTGKTT